MLRQFSHLLILFLLVAAASSTITAALSTTTCTHTIQLIDKKKSSANKNNLHGHLPKPVVESISDILRTAPSSHQHHLVVTFRAFTVDVVGHVFLDNDTMITATGTTTKLHVTDRRACDVLKRLSEMPAFLHLSSENNDDDPSSWKKLGSVMARFPDFNAEQQQQQPAAAAQDNKNFVLFDPWHSYAAAAIRTQRGGSLENGGTVEQVLRSSGKHQLSDIYTDGGAAAKAFFYQATPTLGPYCYYRNRSSAPSVYNCPNISHVAAVHAAQLVSLGVDVAVVDGTNLANFDEFSDVLQLRPTVVLAEEWTKLRAQGIPTPSIAVWNILPSTANLYQYYLSEIYNDKNLSSIVACDRVGQQIFFYPHGSDNAVVAKVASNPGGKPVVTQKMWALYSPQQFASEGTWQFMAPCIDSGKYTTTVADLQKCNQFVVPRSAHGLRGSSTTVSPSYQVAYSSLPFMAAGKLDTFTLQLQFATALDQDADFLVLSTWNEWIAQPQPNPYCPAHGAAASASSSSSCATYAMGMNETQQNPFWSEKLWVDTFGGALARGIEPSVEFGSDVFDMAASCMRVKQFMKLKSSSNNSNKIITFSDFCRASGSQESCCGAGGTPQQTRRNVWSLKNAGNNDQILVINPTELIDLLAGGWTEICNPYSGPTTFCVDRSVLTSPHRGTDGPFLLSVAAPSGGGIELFRCRTKGAVGVAHHFFSNQPNCEGQVTEFSLGYAATNQSSAFPRMLRRCYDPSTGAHFQSLDLACPGGSHEEAQFGYVH